MIAIEAIEAIEANEASEVSFTPMMYSTECVDREEATIREAIEIIQSRIRQSDVYSSPTSVKAFCRLQIASELDEHFCAMFLDNQHRLITFERLFRGTIDGAAVYPRVVVRRALELNASALVFTHNHPSGVAEPSTADRRITTRLTDACNLLDIRVLDHIIVGVEGEYSMAEHGLL